MAPSYKRITNTLCRLLMAVTTVAASSAVVSAVVPGPSVRMDFEGEITKSSVETFINTHSTTTGGELRISSQGGDAEAALRLADWVKEHGLDVRVDLICMSACANYIFFAGENKYIEDGALVIWHGNMESATGQYWIEEFDDLDRRFSACPDCLTSKEKARREEIRLLAETAKRLTKKEKQFYRAVGVDERISRLGTDIIPVSPDAWTATSALLRKMGASKISLPEKYGSPEYMKRNILGSFIAHGPLTVFDVSPDLDRLLDSGK